MENKRNIVLPPATDASLDYPVSMSQSERESLAAEAKLTEERKARKQGKRNLRVVKWLGMVPAIGICTNCDRQFKVPMAAMKRVADAQESLRKQFSEHLCKREGTE